MNFNKDLELEHGKLYEEFSRSFPQYTPRTGFFAELLAFIERELAWRESFLDFVLNGAPSSTAYTEAAVCETLLLREIFAKAQRIIAEHEHSRHVAALAKTQKPWWLEKG